MPCTLIPPSPGYCGGSTRYTANVPLLTTGSNPMIGIRLHQQLLWLLQLPPPKLLVVGHQELVPRSVHHKLGHFAHIETVEKVERIARRENIGKIGRIEVLSDILRKVVLECPRQAALCPALVMQIGHEVAHVHHDGHQRLHSNQRHRLVRVK